MNGDSRGQTATIGIILLFGIVAIGSMSILLVAGETVSDVERNAATEHVTQGFVELSSELETVTYSRDSAKTMDMAVGENGAVKKENAGWINISTTGFSENITLGAVIYENDHDSHVAYQAGGVWRGTGTGTQIISAPPVHYEDATLTLPIHSITGDDDVDSGRLTVEHDETTNYDNISFVENEIVTLEIQSEYYAGWKDYFVGHTNDAVVREVDHDRNTVVVELGRTDLEGAFDTGISVSGNVTEGNNANKTFDPNEVEEGVSMPELDSMIADILKETNTSDYHIGTMNGTEAAGDQFTNGTYFAEGMALDEDVTVDLSEGEVILVVDGDVDINKRVTIEKDGETDASLKIYTTGDMVVEETLCVDDCDGPKGDAEHVQVYGTSNMTATFENGDGGDFEGTLYAPSNDPIEQDCQGGGSAQVCVDSNTDIFGSIVAGSVHFQSASDQFNYDMSLKNNGISATPDGYVRPPQVTYLNVVVQEVSVTNG